MKQLFIMTAGVVAIVSMVVFGFTFRQATQEEAFLLDDLQRRTTLLADSFKESIRPSYLNNATGTMQVVLDKFAGRERLLGGDPPKYARSARAECPPPARLTSVLCYALKKNLKFIIS